jgi:hypothetical protein
VVLGLVKGRDSNIFLERAILDRQLRLAHDAASMLLGVRGGNSLASDSVF